MTMEYFSTLPDYKDYNAVFGDDLKVWPSKHVEEHPLIESIRAAVLQYRLQSASHFDLSIEVHQTQNAKYAGHSTKIDRSFRIEVLFHNFSNRLYRICRVQVREPVRQSHHVLGYDFDVQERGKFIPLHKFLGKEYPNLNASVTSYTLYSWWGVNGKSFNWDGLPTEMKEYIIGSCIESSRTAESTDRTVRHWKQNKRKPGICELADHLGQWTSLLRVSHQVRAITLRVCFAGVQHMPSIKGICLLSMNNSDFTEKIRRLGKFYQLADTKGVPVDEKSYAQANTYRQFPKLHPELKQYATLRHGIRRVCLKLDFASSFEFFRITKHGYQDGWQSRYVGIEVLERLPELRDLVIILPDFKGRLDDKPYHPGPPLFFDSDFACPRILHRILYEQAAEVLAQYSKVKLYGFMDDKEAERFEALREEAVLKLKFTPRELTELYDEDGGGVRLEEPIIPGVHAEQAEGDTLATLPSVIVRNSFWPPKCRCERRCRHVIVDRR